MRILQLIYYFPPHVGGQERYVYFLSKYLVKLGHEVHVVTSNFPESKKFEKMEGIRVERHKVAFKILRNPIVPNFLRISKKFKDFDIVHAHNEHALYSITSAYIRMRGELYPFVLTNHGRVVFGERISDFIEKSYINIIGKRIFGSCDAIVVNSKSDKNFILSLNPNCSERVHIIPNAIDPEFLTHKLRSIKSKNYSIDISADTKLLYVGALIKRKGVEWLIRAMKSIKEEFGRNVKCIIVGDGPDKEYFGNLVEKYDLSFNTDRITLNVPSAVIGAKGEILSSRVSVVGKSMKSYPIMAEIKYGSGRIILLSDPSIFINDMFDENRQFIENLVSYLGVKRYYFDESHHSDFNPYSLTTVYIHREFGREKAFQVFLVVSAIAVVAESGVLRKILEWISRIIPKKERDLFEDLPEWVDVNLLDRIIQEMRTGSKLGERYGRKTLYGKSGEGGQ